MIPIKKLAMIIIMINDINLSKNKQTNVVKLLYKILLMN